MRHPWTGKSGLIFTLSKKEEGTSAKKPERDQTNVHNRRSFLPHDPKQIFNAILKKHGGKTKSAGFST